MHHERWNTEFCGSKILGGADQLAGLFSCGIRAIVVAFGECRPRYDLVQQLAEKGFELPNIVHPRATVSCTASLGVGVFVGASAIINTGANIGKAVIINSGSIIEHDNIIGPGSHVSPGACLGGWVTVGEMAWIGLGAVIKDRIHIGALSVIGAGSVVTKDIPDNMVAYGVPARVRREVNSACI